MSKIAILQPSFIPWTGYFEQIYQVDTFIFYDDVQYTKNDWRNRNKILINGRESWLTIPVSYHGKTKINEVVIDETTKWRKIHLKTLHQYYGKSKYFDEIYSIIENNLEKENNLSSLCINIVKDISNYLDFKTEFFLSSELNILGDKNKRLINICKHFGCDTYYSGLSAKSYIDINLFCKNNIRVMFQDYKPLSYFQNNKEFVPYLSILDVLFHYGKNSKKIIIGENK